MENVKIGNGNISKRTGYSITDEQFENIAARTVEILDTVSENKADRGLSNVSDEDFKAKADAAGVLDAACENKADKATTLAGYGILDGLSFVEGYEDKIDYYQGKVVDGQWLPVLYKIIGSTKIEDTGSGTIIVTSAKFNEYYLYAVAYNKPIAVDGSGIDVTQIKLGHDGLYIRKGHINGSINTRDWGTWKSLENKNVDLSGYYTKDEVYAKDEIDDKMGNVETALDNIIIIQNELLGV